MIPAMLFSPLSPSAARRRIWRGLATVCTLAALAPPGSSSLWTLEAQAPQVARVSVRMETLELPTDEEGLPDVNPPFEALGASKPNYPYPIRDTLTGRQSVARHRALVLENDYLKLVVLPDLGGHIYSCVDKVNGHELFYANKSLRKAQVALRGAWSAFGVEFNFPVSHSWVSLSPVDFATTAHADGSASIWVGNVDRVTGMQWLVQLVMHPGRSVVEQRVTLHNGTSARHRFYWWTNAAVRVTDDSRMVYPMQYTASHGFRDVDTWPIDHTGVDLSVFGNHKGGPVSRFAHASREPFMGVWHPVQAAGVAHYSSPLDAPTKKLWSWGGDADALDWRRVLSDDFSAYVEIQAGLFRNQETYGYLDPQATIRFTEYWLPVRGIGGFSRVTPDAAIHVERLGSGNLTTLAVGLNVTRPLTDATLLVLDGARAIARERLTASPADVITRKFPNLSSATRFTVALDNASGERLIEHTEGTYDTATVANVTLGPQPSAPPRTSEEPSDVVQRGDQLERDGRPVAAFKTYAEGLERAPTNVPLLKAAGRLAVGLGRYAQARRWLEGTLASVSNDAEAQFYLGMALVGFGDDPHARPFFEAAQHDRSWRAPALFELARLEARAGRISEAVNRITAAAEASSSSTRIGAIEVALLRRSGQNGRARERLATLRAIDPTSGMLRHEAVLLGASDPGLWPHLDSDVERLLDIAGGYMSIGAFDLAEMLLERPNPAGERFAEPGDLPPSTHPLVGYYLAYARERSGEDARDAYAAASRQPTAYVFPNRADSAPVLRRAIAVNPSDATAHYLLGSLLLAKGDADGAIAAWTDARRLNPRIPVLHRNLAASQLFIRRNDGAALEIAREGIGADPTNPAIYALGDQALSLLGRSAGERVAMLERYPHKSGMPAALVLKLALALSEAGRGDDAERLFRDRFFPREEQGTNVREVYLEVRLRHAEALARAGRASDAQAIVRTIGQPVDGVAFTRDGLDVFLGQPRVQMLVGDILAAAGQPDQAAMHWRRALESGRGGPLRAVYSQAAAKRLALPPAPDGRAQLEQALRGIEDAMAAGTNASGSAMLTRGLLLRALGRPNEARARLREVLRLPDQRLSHALARRALAQ